MLNDGRITIEPNASMETHLSGNHVKLPHGFRVYAAVYHLRGGVASQDEFFATRKLELDVMLNIDITSADLDTLPSIEYSGENVVELDAKERTWLKSPENKARTREYVTLPIQTIPQTCGPSDGSIMAEDGPESEDEDKVDELIPSDPGTPDSPPTSAFALNCRCGRQGNGNEKYDAENEGLAIQCNQCNEWSHVACQRNARASNLLPHDNFICNSCSFQGILPPEVPRTSARM